MNPLELKAVVDALSAPLGGIVLVFVARYAKDAARALQERNAQTDALTARTEKLEKDLNEAWNRLRHLDGSVGALLSTSSLRKDPPP
jgi:predicted nuclease with TOPRIM domain